jgi:hypothetical protein
MVLWKKNQTRWAKKKLAEAAMTIKLAIASGYSKSPFK